MLQKPMKTSSCPDTGKLVNFPAAWRAGGIGGEGKENYVCVNETNPGACQEIWVCRHGYKLY